MSGLSSKNLTRAAPARRLKGFFDPRATSPKISIAFPSAMYLQLAKIAETDGVSFATVARRLIAQALATGSKLSATAKQES